MTVMSNLNKTLRIPQRNIGPRKEINVILNNKATGRPLNEAVRIERHVRSNLHNPRLSQPKVKPPHEFHIIPDLNYLRMRKKGIRRDFNILPARLEFLSIIHCLCSAKITQPYPS